MAYPMIHHRSPEFSAIFREVHEGLQYLFQTKGIVLTLTASGTGAMEAAVANLLSRGDKIITVEGGKFGERWTELGRAYGALVKPMATPWGQAVTPEQIRETLRQQPDAKAIFLTHSETSTGAAIDLQTIAGVIREHSNALIVVDGITSIGSLPFKMDEWFIDCAVTGSQKGPMIPPGLSFIALSPRAWKAAEQSNLPKYYFDLKRARQSFTEDTTPFTPAASLVLGLHEALKLIRREGIENLWRRHEVIATATRAGVQALGLELFAKAPSNSLTAVIIPEIIRAKANLVAHLRTKYGITVAGGQGPLKGKIFRIAHLGHYDRLDMISLISALEMALEELGWEFPIGEGVKAAQQVFHQLNDQPGAER